MFVHTHNHSPTAAIKQHSTPFELWHGHKPDVSHFRVFGCLAYVHIQSDQRKGLQPHAQKCIFVGYPSEYKAWQFYNLSTKKLLISNNAIFDEHYFPGLSTQPVDLVIPGELQHPVDQVGVEHSVIFDNFSDQDDPLVELRTAGTLHWSPMDECTIYFSG